MTRLIALSFGIVSKVIFWLSIASVWHESCAAVETGVQTFLLAEVTIDLPNCTEDDWHSFHQTIYAILSQADLGLSDTPINCGCEPLKGGHCGPRHKAVVKLLYSSKNGTVSAGKTTLTSLEDKLQIAKNPEPKPGLNYICSSLKIISKSDSDYKACVSNFPSSRSSTISVNFPSSSSPTISNADKQQSDKKPNAGTIAGAVVGALAGIGALLAAAAIIYKKLNAARQVEDAGSHSDVSPIIPGAFGIGEAPNSVPPAGTG